MSPEDRAKLIDLLGQVVTASEIAAMAGVTRSAVSNWVALDATFPGPVAKVQDYRLYDPAEVSAWLEARAKRRTQPTFIDTSEDTK